jgi:hypothetical protein
MVSTGGSPHFMRPNFPTSPGMYPSDLVIELAPFDLATIDHFIYLERPQNQALQDGKTFGHVFNYTRLSEKGRLMPTSGDYQTVGELYGNIRQAFEDLSLSHGDNARFSCG